MSDSIKFGFGALVALGYVAGLVILIWHGSITGSEGLAAAGAVVLPVVGAAIHSNGVSAAQQSSTVGTRGRSQ